MSEDNKRTQPAIIRRSNKMTWLTEVSEMSDIVLIRKEKKSIT